MPTGITITARMPSRLACRATPWAWFPAEAATTPRPRSSSLSSPSLLAAPRSLNEPTACRLSSLSRTSHPQAFETAALAMVGVLITRPAIRSAACLTSRMPSSIGAGITGWRPSLLQEGQGAALEPVPSARARRSPTPGP